MGLTVGVWKGCVLDQYSKLVCRRRLGSTVGWDVGREGKSRVVLAGRGLERQPEWAVLHISHGGGGPGVQGP